MSTGATCASSGSSGIASCGREGSSFDIFKSASAEGRITKDSNDIISSWVDQLLQQKGVIARRDNSIFCTGTSKRAEEYGTVYEIFPINGFHYSYAAGHDDIILSPHSGVRDKWLKPGPNAISRMNQLIDNENTFSGRGRLELILTKIENGTFSWSDIHGLPYYHPVWEAMQSGVKRLVRAFM